MLGVLQGVCIDRLCIDHLQRECNIQSEARLMAAGAGASQATLPPTCWLAAPRATSSQVPLRPTRFAAAVSILKSRRILH